jgi:predicted ester cyclase
MRFRGTQTGTLGAYPGKGKALESEYLVIYRIQNSVIAEAWTEWDNLASLRQLGHIA